MPLQDWIHRVEEGAGAKWLRRLATILAFAALAAVFDSEACREGVPPTCQGFRAPDAMEGAQLARNIAQGRGFVTDSIRPLDTYLLNRMHDGAAQRALQAGFPDLSQAPVYPVVLAGLMKVLPFDFSTKPGQVWYYLPESWIDIFNQVLYFVAVVLLFSVARRLFDLRVAWAAAVIFAATALFWRFSVSGLSTILLEVIFLAMVRAMLALEARSRAPEPKSVVGWALLIGALVGVGTLTRYSFGWIIFPVMGFGAWAAARARGRTVLFVLAAFLIVTVPWIARNASLTGNLFGASGFAIVEQTPPFPGHQLEQSLNPELALRQVHPASIRQKAVTNLQNIVGTELPTLGGNWLTAFFAVGLLIPFRSPALRRMRWFLLAALLMWILTEAMGRTALSNDTPVVNSENLLVLLAPLVFVYGAGLVYILVDQLNVDTAELRAAVVGLVAVVVSVPLLLQLLGPPEIPDNYPYAPRHIQLTAQLMGEHELTMSDIPWAVAWYGNRPCMWLTLNDSDEFYRVNTLKPIVSVFLTQRTTDQGLLRQITGSTNSWGRFFWDCWAHGEVPTGFPLKKAPTDFLPDQLLVSDHVRW